MTGGAGQMRGSSLVHKDTADLFKWHLSASFAHCLNDQERGLIIDMVDGNFAGVTEYPHATLGAIDDAELAESLQIDLGLKQLGWRHSAEEIAERYGRKIPEDEDDVLTLQEQKQTERQAGPEENSGTTAPAPSSGKNSRAQI